jgi:hypothetical protein
MLSLYSLFGFSFQIALYVTKLPFDLFYPLPTWGKLGYHVHSEYCFLDLSLEVGDFILIAHYLAIFLVNVKKLKHLEVGLFSLGILVHLKIIILP